MTYDMTARRPLFVGWRCVQDYNVTIVYYLTHYLVDLVTEPSGRRVLKLDTIDQARDWLAADVLVFDSWHWWPYTGPKQP